MNLIGLYKIKPEKLQQISAMPYLITKESVNHRHSTKMAKTQPAIF